MIKNDHLVVINIDLVRWIPLVRLIKAHPYDHYHATDFLND